DTVPRDRPSPPPAPFKRRALGQHFLRDSGIARAIVDLVAPTPADLVVEIGPGQGALTGELARRAGRTPALEVDRTLIERGRAALRGRGSRRLRPAPQNACECARIRARCRRGNGSGGRGRRRGRSGAAG